MNGAEVLLRTLVNAGVEVCFTNPGTSEMQFVAAMDRVEGMRSVLGLFEGVATGAADGYARMTDRPACTLLHLGPGLANGLANLHNAWRARVPLVNLVGDHATYHRQFDAPLTSDIESYARPVSAWIRSSTDARELGGDAREAVAAAAQLPGRVATLIVPADCSWKEAGEPVEAPEPAAWRRPSYDAVVSTARALRQGEPAVILMNGRALRAPGLELASRIAASSGARLMCDTFTTRLQRGAGRAPIERMPYFGEQAAEILASARHLVLVGSRPPVSFFAYPDTPSWLTPEGCQVHELASPEEDPVEALESLLDEMGARDAKPQLQASAPMQPARGELSIESVAQSIGALMPEGAIVSDEAATSGLPLGPATAGAPPHDWLSLTGGAIGQGLPVGTGAAVACPDRKVICLQADGSAMYTIQSLWTQARENLDVTTVIYANRQYRILQFELMRVGVEQPGPKANSVLDIGHPPLDFVEIARGMGVRARRAESIEDFNRFFGAAMQEPGPKLIEVPV
ncbi:MAG TPA: acetolactate synthase large subunit [Gammaproteobacteria bacterium]|nr:acetolactate synthase large subunit [Gammaproteobacteria bacterium]